MWIIAKSRHASYEITPKALSRATLFLLQELSKLYEKTREAEFQENNTLMYDFEAYYFLDSPERERSKMEKYVIMDTFSERLWHLEKECSGLISKGENCNPSVSFSDGEYTCVDQAKAIAFIRKVHHFTLLIRDKLTRYPIVTFATQSRVDEDLLRFKNFVSRYKE